MTEYDYIDPKVDTSDTPLEELLRGRSMFMPEHAKLPLDRDIPLDDLYYISGSHDARPSGTVQLVSSDGQSEGSSPKTEGIAGQKAIPHAEGSSSQMHDDKLTLDPNVGNDMPQ